MEDPIFNADAVSPAARKVDDPTAQPFLKVTPRHFFSTTFDMEIIEDYRDPNADDRGNSRDPAPARLLDLNLLLLIVFVGLPVLACCIWSSAI